jgi:anti-sigma regulatory factor (Ser/Thr protein kinase)
VTAVLEGAAPTAGFEHQTLFYRQDSEFLDGVQRFVRDGLAAGEAVVVAVPQPRLDLLRDALGDAGGDVEFLDMADVGANPARIIAVWEDAVAHHVATGRGLRGVGEPAYPGRSDAELLECHLHELLLNRAFAGGAAWRLLCPYDARHLPRAVCARAAAAHPVVLAPVGPVSNSGYLGDDACLDPFRTPLPAPSDGVLRGTFGARDVPALRRTVTQFARSCGLPPEKVEALELAAAELAVNSVRHGGGAGTLAMWLEPGAALVEIADTGHVVDPLVGRRRPTLEQEGGRGVYLVNQLCDLVHLRSSPEGTTVRLVTWL